MSKVWKTHKLLIEVTARGTSTRKVKEAILRHIDTELPSLFCIDYGKMTIKDLRRVEQGKVNNLEKEESDVGQS